MEIKSHKLKSNGCFSIIERPYSKRQHPNQQEGLDLYVQVLDHDTGEINTVKLYENKKGLHFKKRGSWYMSEFTKDVIYIPFQIIDG